MTNTRIHEILKTIDRLTIMKDYYYTLKNRALKEQDKSAYDKYSEEYDDISYEIRKLRRQLAVMDTEN